MRWNRFHTPISRIAVAGLCATLGAVLLAGPARAQLPTLGSQMPGPRLFTVVPNGGKVGSTTVVAFTGLDLEEPQTLYFSCPGIKVEPILPPPPPPADPKKPKPPSPPPPPVISKFKVTIPAEAPLGIHDVRLVSKWGISNPRAFVIGDLAEVAEKEPNNDVAQAQKVELNSTITGAIAAPTDVDFFVFSGKKGQRVVCSCLASSIDSRLSAALELFNSDGQMLGHNRDYLGTDALMDCTLPADGDYYVRLSEFTHTLGSLEHFYRLSITTAPWIDAVFPPVVEPGKPAKLTVYGRNLPGGQPDPKAVVDGRVLEKITVTVDVPSDPVALQRLDYRGLVLPVSSGMDGFEYRLKNASGSSNSFLLTYAQAPVVLDNEANDTAETAQEVPIPCEIAGRIEKKHDRDWYSFTAKKGDVINIEVYSERLGAPTDMQFVLRNPATKQDLREEDDNAETLTPLKFRTPTSDPRFRFVVPADGKYLLLLKSQYGDSQAGPRHLYRVRMTADLPDFRLVALHPDDNRPDASTVRQGGQRHYQVLAWRQDGWNGPITLTAEGLPAGVTSSPQVLGPGLKEAILVFTAAADAAPFAGEIKIKGTATINGQTVVREARAAGIVWPIQPGQGIPPIARLDRSVVLAVRDKAPFSLTATLDKNTLFHGDKATLTVKLARLWPDFKTPLQVIPVDLPPGLTISPGIPPGPGTAALAVTVNPTVLPGTYNIVLGCGAPIPFNKDPMAKQKPNINIVQVSTPVTLTILPKQVATLTMSNPNLTVKIGMQAEAVVKVARLYDYPGEFKVQVILPPTAKGVTVDDVTIPAGKDEAKFLIKVAAGSGPINLANLTLKATALVNGTVPTVHEMKFNVNVIK